jgi:hypothetical protein
LKYILTLSTVILLAAGPLVAQQAQSTNGGAGAQSHGAATLVSSPEPITMLALAGGAGAALGMAKRRRNRKK